MVCSLYAQSTRKGIFGMSFDDTLSFAFSLALFPAVELRYGTSDVCLNAVWWSLQRVGVSPNLTHCHSPHKYFFEHGTKLKVILILHLGLILLNSLLSVICIDRP